MIKEDIYLKNLADICLTKSKELGSSDASVLVMNSVSENVNIRNRKIDGSERSDNLGITLTTYIGKKKASISFSTQASSKPLFFNSPLLISFLVLLKIFSPYFPVSIV